MYHNCGKYTMRYNIIFYNKGAKVKVTRAIILNSMVILYMVYKYIIYYTIFLKYNIYPKRVHVQAAHLYPYLKCLYTSYHSTYIYLCIQKAYVSYIMYILYRSNQFYTL